MSSARRKRPADVLELNMTAMCDVIFQLLIYLILTAAPPLVLGTLDTKRPRTSGDIHPGICPVQLMVFSDAYVVEGKRMNADGLRNVLAQLGSIDRNQTIAIKCAPDSPHEKLIQLLDMCSQSGLGNVSLLSM